MIGGVGSCCCRKEGQAVRYYGTGEQTSDKEEKKKETKETGEIGLYIMALFLTLGALSPSNLA